MSHAYLGIDIGLSGTRAAVIGEDGAVLGLGQSGQQLTEDEGDPAQWLADALAAARAALAEAGRNRVEAIGIGALGPAPILVDERGEALFKAPLFGIDIRSEAHRRRLLAEHRLPEDALDLDHALPKVEWLKERDPETFARARCCVDATGFIVGSLTNRFVMDEPTRDYYSAAGLSWPVPLAGPAEVLSVAGPLREVHAGALGIAAGTPVAVGSIDSYVDIAGVGATRPGDAVLLAGTTLILGRIVAEAEAGNGLRVTPAIGGHRFFGGWTSSFGATLDWSECAFRDCHDDDAALSPFLMLPYLAGERSPVWNAEASGIILGLRDTWSPEQLSAAARDGIILTALDIASRVDAAQGPASRYLACGGALSAPHVGQCLADALDAEIAAIHCGNARAAAMLAAESTGRSIPRRVSKAFQPQPAQRGAWHERLAIYRDLYAATAPLMKRWNDLVTRERQCQLA